MSGFAKSPATRLIAAVSLATVPVASQAQSFGQMLLGGLRNPGQQQGFGQHPAQSNMPPLQQGQFRASMYFNDPQTGKSQGKPFAIDLTTPAAAKVVVPYVQELRAAAGSNGIANATIDSTGGRVLFESCDGQQCLQTTPAGADKACPSDNDPKSKAAPFAYDPKRKDCERTVTQENVLASAPQLLGPGPTAAIKQRVGEQGSGNPLFGGMAKPKPSANPLFGGPN